MTVKSYNLKDNTIRKIDIISKYLELNKSQLIELAIEKYKIERGIAEKTMEQILKEMGEITQ